MASSDLEAEAAAGKDADGDEEAEESAAESASRRREADPGMCPEQGKQKTHVIFYFLK